MISTQRVGNFIALQVKIFNAPSYNMSLELYNVVHLDKVKT